MPAETHMEHNPIGRDEVVAIVCDRVAEILEAPIEQVTLNTAFARDLDADSLGLIELVSVLEEEFGDRTVGFSFDDEDLADLETVNDAVEYIVVKLGI